MCGSAVSSEAKVDVFGQAKQTVQMVVRRCSTQGRDGEIDPVAREGDDIHVAFDDDKFVDLPERLSRFVQAIELAALMEQHRFR